MIEKKSKKFFQDENPPPMRGRGRASRHRLAKVPEMLPMDPRPLPSTSGSTTSGSSDRSSSYQFWILKYFSDF